MANYLVTGAAGFIGARTSELLIKDGHTVIGIDNLNEAYDPRMKEYRLQRLQSMVAFRSTNWIFQTNPSLTSSREKVRWRDQPGSAGRCTCKCG